MGEQKVAADVAEQEFKRFTDAMDLDVDPAGMDDEDKRSFNDAKRRIIAALCNGSLVIDEKGQPVFTPSLGNTQPITFFEPTGASLMAGDQKKKGHDHARMFAVMGDMTRQPATRFANMPSRELKVCLSIAGLFLGG